MDAADIVGSISSETSEKQCMIQNASVEKGVLYGDQVGVHK